MSDQHATETTAAVAMPEPHPALRTALCDLVGVRYPVVQTGMGWVAGPRLVAATAAAGGLGILASATLTVAQMADALAEIRSRTDAPFGVNLRTDVADVGERVDLMIEAGARVASFAQAPNPALVARCQEAGLVVVPTIGARRHAEKVAEWGVNAVIAQGAEGGGHTGTVPTSLLLPEVVDAVGDRLVVIGAGGYFDGRGLVAALAYGASGIAMGTRFLLTSESRVPDAVKERYLATPVTGTVVTTKVDGAPQRVIRTELIDHLEGASWVPQPAPSPHQRPRLPQGDAHHPLGPVEGRPGHEEGQRARLDPGGDGGQRPRDDQGRARRGSNRRGGPADRPGGGRDPRPAERGRGHGRADHRGQRRPRPPRRLTDRPATGRPYARLMDAPAPSGRAVRAAPDGVILAIACVAQFMVVLDVSIVNVALPSIGRELHYSPTGLQWVVNAYVLTFAGFLLLGGRMADVFGRRRIYLLGVAVFSLASLAGGLAQNSTELTVARAVQGLGGAIVSPVTLTIIITTFSGVRLGKALGAWSAVAGAGGAAGVLLGGILTSQLGWRWVLFVNVPIGAAALIAAALFLGEAKGMGERVRLDIAGAITVTAGLATLVYAIVGTDQHPWGSAATLVPLAIALVLLASFFVIETTLATHPLVPMRLFRSRWVTGANVIIFLVGAGFFSLWYFLSLYLQNVLGYGPLKTGLAFLPMTIGIVIAAQISGRQISVVGARPLLVIGTALTVIGFFWLSTIGPTSDYWTRVLPPGVCISFAVGLLFTPLAAAATRGVAQNESGLASGVLQTSRQMGGCLGLAVLATIAIDHTHSVLRAGHTSVDAALSAGYARAFAVTGVLSVVALAAAFIVPNLRRSNEAVAPVPGAVPGSEPAASGLGAEPA